ncbi:hypothetical protein lbkm_2768 [Lachnospiraceae bacterium KM106-2]|nr:hypothetical protein lbkm_2768 [Lachnospiraceae bacterium KM106-2]
MLDLIGFVIGWVLIEGVVSATLDYGGARHSIPRVFHFLFPCMLRHTKKASWMDLIYCMLWHIYVYSWLINGILHKNFDVYRNEYAIIFNVAIFLYTPHLFYVIFKQARWEDKNN